MPPRRSHKKSKAGCQRCKNRKIKCDEVHPTCGNCSKHGVPCDFEGPMTPDAAPISLHRQSTTETTSHSSQISSPRTNSTLIPIYQAPTQLIRASHNPVASRTLELKLMHHFTARTCLTFSDTVEQNMAWQVDVPTIAYDAQYLMDAILAVSALHMRVTNPDDHGLIRASHAYMASALEQYSSLLNGGLCELNAEALFSTAALIAFQSSASRRFEDGHDGGTYALPLAWFHSFQGVKTVVMASWQWLRTSDKIYPIINSQPALTLDLDPERKLFFAPLLEGIDDHILQYPEMARAETKQAYIHAVAHLNWAHSRPVRNRILGFAATVSRRFVELMAQHEPRALVIASCFFALTKMVDDVWWLQGIAKREVNGIATLVTQEWWPKMEWALTIANHEGPVDEQTWGYSVQQMEDMIKQEPEVNNVHEHIDLLAAIMNASAPPPPVD